MAAHSITNLFYILRKVYSIEERKEVLLNICKKNLKEANSSYEEVKKIVDDLKESTSLLKKINKLAVNLNKELVKIFESYNSVLVKMEAVTQRKIDFRKFNADEKKSFEILVTTALLLKFLINQNILDEGNKINRKVEAAISESKCKLERLEISMD